MKKVEKTIHDLLHSITEVKEDQLGNIQGGFTVIELPGNEENTLGNNFCTSNMNCPCNG